MREDSIVRFLIALGVDPYEVETSGEWVNCKCPFAPWTHEGGADTHPSFGIRINEEGLSYYYCFGCVPDAWPVGRMLHAFFILTGDYPWRAAEIYANEEYYQDEEERLDELRSRDAFRKKRRAIRPLPQKVVKQYKLLQGAKGFEARRCREYLQNERLIPDWIANYYQVRYDDDNRALIFPLTDRRGAIFLLRSRSRREKKIWTINPKKAGYSDLKFPKLKEVGVWFGMGQVDWRESVMAIEAELDVLRLAALGVFNVIASATSSVTDAQIKTLCMAKRIYLGYDADKAGKHAHRRIIEGVGRKARIWALDWSKAKRHPKFIKEGRKMCNDAGELLDRAEYEKVFNSKELIN